MFEFVRIVFVVLALIACGELCAQSPAAESTGTPATVRAADISGSYKLSPADAIDVQVFGESDLSKEYVISENGTISFPLIGTVKVSGLRSAQIERLLTKKLQKGFLVNPRVNVTIRGYRPFFVSGQVVAPGSFKFEPGLTIRKALTMAGGLTERASKSKIYVLSEGKASTKPRKAKLDEPLRPGDVITVEESFF
jgi:polysaccharide biosynthesis/export protein VpsN